MQSQILNRPLAMFTQFDIRLLDIHKALCQKDFLSRFEITKNALIFYRGEIKFELIPSDAGTSFKLKKDGNLLRMLLDTSQAISFFD